MLCIYSFFLKKKFSWHENCHLNKSWLLFIMFRLSEMFLCLPAKMSNITWKWLRLYRACTQPRINKRKLDRPRISGVVSFRNLTKLKVISNNRNHRKFEWTHGDLHNVKDLDLLQFVYHCVLFFSIHFIFSCAYTTLRKRQRHTEWESKRVRKSNNEEKGQSHLS